MTIFEKENIRRVFPNNKVIIKINPKNPPTASKLSLTEWKVIMQVDGKKNLQEIINDSALGEEESLAIFHELYQKNLIEIVVDENILSRIAGEDFFKDLENILVKIIGPVSMYLIDDVLWELNETRESFIIEKIPSLAEAISREILDDKKQVQFQEEILALIKSYEIY
jgi:hypothetical protein